MGAMNFRLQIKACLSGVKTPSQYATQFDVRPEGCGFLITAKYSLDEEPLRGEYSRMEYLEPLINAVLGEALSSVASCHQCSEVTANIAVDDRIVTEGKMYNLQIKKRATRRNLDNLISWVTSSLTISLLFIIATVVSLFTSNNIIYGCNTSWHQKGVGGHKRPGRHHRQQVNHLHPPTAMAKGGVIYFS